MFNYYEEQVVGLGWELGPDIALTAQATMGDYVNPAVCAAECFDATYTHTTAAYQTLDTPRDITVVYRGDRVAVRPILQVDLFAAAQTAWSEMRLQAQIHTSPSTSASISFLPTNTTTLPIDLTSRTGTGYQPLRISAQFDASSYATGVYPVDISVTMIYENGDTIVKTTSTQVIINNGQLDATVAKGWGIAGLQRLHLTNNGYLVTDGTGAAIWYPQLDWIVADGTKLTYSSVGSYYTRHYPDSSQARFDASGRMIRTTDRRGLVTVYTYDGTGRLISVADPMWTVRGGTGPTITLAYGTYGLSSIVEAGIVGGGRTTTYTVNSSKQLTRITDPDTKYTSFTYDGAGRLATATDRRGGAIQFGYDTLTWKLAKLTVPSIPIDNGSGGTTAQSLVTTFRPWQVVALPTSTHGKLVERDSVLGKVTDPLGRTTTFTVNQYGQTLVQTDPAGRVTTILRDGLYPNTVVSPDTATDLMTYENGRLTGYKPSGGSWTYYEYGARGQLTKVFGKNTPTVRLYLRANSGDPDSVVTWAPGGLVAVQRFTYDTLGRVIRTSNAVGDTTRLHYDGVTGNLDSTYAAGNRWTKKKFDRFGRDSATSGAGQPTTRALYDVMNRVTALYDGVHGTPIQVTYDALFRTSVRNPKSELADSTEYNALGWVTKRVDPYNTTRASTYRYDAAGQLKASTDRRGNVVSYQYDVLGRPSLRSYGTTTDSYTYHYNGELASISNSIAATNWTRSGGDENIKTTFGWRAFTIYQYYADTLLGATDSVTVSMNNQWLMNLKVLRDDSTAAPTSLWLESARALATAYDVLGRPVKQSLGSVSAPTVRTDSAYTTLSGPIGSLYSPVATTAFHRAYRYDTVGRLAVVQAPATVGNSIRTTYGYDALGQLTTVTTGTQPCSVWPSSGPSSDPFGFSYSCGTGTTTTYTYDAAGNRTDRSGTYATGNRILTFNGFTYTHDAEGNIIHKVGTGVNVSYAWDALNRLVAVTDSLSGHEHRYTYDAADRLVRRETDGVIDRYWVWDGDNLLLEADGAFTIRSQYVHAGIDQPIVTRTGPYFFPGFPMALFLDRLPQQDALGNVIGTLSTSQTVQDLMEYDAWGSPTIVSSDTATRLLWKGTLWEANEVVGSTGLYYMRARWYDPALGRFLSEDPLGVDGGMNRYVFAGNDPINGADPSGLRGTTGAALGWDAMSASGWIAVGPDHPEEVSAFPVSAFAERGLSLWGEEPQESYYTCQNIAYRMLESYYNEDPWPWRINSVLYAHACDQHYPQIAYNDLWDWAEDLDPYGYWYWLPDFLYDFPMVGFDDPLDRLTLCTDAQAAYNNELIWETSTKDWACWMEESAWIEPPVLEPVKVTARATSWLDNIHFGLDLVGMVPGMEWADLANAGLYTIEGDAVNAGLSLAAAVPVVGTAVAVGKAAKVAKAGTKYTKSSLKLGREMHKAYKAGADGIKEFRLPSGKRIDFLDINSKTIYELKPFNPRAIKAGQKQLDMYLKELQNIPEYKGVNWKRVLDTY